MADCASAQFDPSLLLHSCRMGAFIEKKTSCWVTLFTDAGCVGGERTPKSKQLYKVDRCSG